MRIHGLVHAGFLVFGCACGSVERGVLSSTQGLADGADATGGALSGPPRTVEINILYVHGVQPCDSSKATSDQSLASVRDAVRAELAAQLEAYGAAHPGVQVVLNDALANLYLAPSSGHEPSDSRGAMFMDDWEVGAPGCGTARQGEPCTTAYEWRYRLRSVVSLDAGA